MILHISRLLEPDQAAEMARALSAAVWVDGRVTAGHQSVLAKNNQQLDERDPLARELGLKVQAALDRSSLFFSGVLPRKIFPPLFNRYQPGHQFGDHVDNAVRYDQSNNPVRTDLSATLFLSPPESYDGGELIIGRHSGVQSAKLPAGDLLIYPSTTVHRVEPITRGERLASFFWIQSLIRDEGRRQLMFELDVAVQKLNKDTAGHPALVELTGVYHNLLRQWTEL
jgi:PKHD-type hydroxylase